MLVLAACGNKEKKSYDEMGSDGITVRTENLRSNLMSFTSKGVLIGQRYGTLEGIGWQNDSDRSDFKEICNDRPAVTGYELRGIESGKDYNPDNMQFKWIKANAVQFFKKGGLVTMTWTAPNPNGNDELIKEWTRNLSKFLSSLQDGYGIKAPVALFLLPRNGNNWYDKLPHDEYTALYHEIADELKENEVTNVILGYSEACTDNEPLPSFKYYPEQVDVAVVNITYLQTQGKQNINAYRENLKNMLPKLSQFALDHNAVPGLTTGIEGVTDSSYFNQVLLPAIKQTRLSYVMFGENHGDYKDGHFYTPYPGEGNDMIHGFMEFYNDPTTIFLSHLNGLYLKME